MLRGGEAAACAPCLCAHLGCVPVVLLLLLLLLLPLLLQLCCVPAVLLLLRRRRRRRRRRRWRQQRLRLLLPMFLTEDRPEVAELDLPARGLVGVPDLQTHKAKAAS